MIVDNCSINLIACSNLLSHTKEIQERVETVCHLGVVANITAIGTGNSGIIYNSIARTTDTVLYPIFVSQDHRISLETTIKILLVTCLYRLLELVGRSDQDSRTYICPNKELKNKHM
ncbi:hypothetical protein BJ944DRAFT_253883 [Cunninghamella echinulata]|nr:hypothetical protein BJ944DRAFT_253883 [Cunninghamella echinulata]